MLQAAEAELDGSIGASCQAAKLHLQNENRTLHPYLSLPGYTVSL